MSDQVTHRESWLDGWGSSRTDETRDPRAEAEEAWRIAFGDSPGAALAAREPDEHGALILCVDGMADNYGRPPDDRDRRQDQVRPIGLCGRGAPRSTRRPGDG